MIDVERARRETKGCETVLHFNNAGASLMPDAVVDAVVRYVQLEQSIGGYEAEDREAEVIGSFYSSAARLLNCDTGEIAFIENATRAWDMAFYSLPFKVGDKILTAVAEYASNYIAFLQVAKRLGVIIEVIPNDESGQVSIDALEQMIDGNVKLIAITHVPTNGGLVNPAAEVGRIANQAGVTYLLDACQSVGQMPVDVQSIGCDILSCTGRKFLRGPRGTGILYFKKELLNSTEPVFLDLHAAEWNSRDTYIVRDDARRFETWECSYSAKIGLTTALDYAMEWGLLEIQSRVALLAGRLRNQLSSIPGVDVKDIGMNRCGIVTFTKEGLHPDEIFSQMRQQAINVSTSTVKGTRLDMEGRQLQAVVRASVHYYNIESEIDRFCEALSSLQAVVPGD